MTVPYVHASGDGPPAVLVHGTFVGGPQSFAAQAPLSEDHRLLIVDAPTPDPAPSRLRPLGARHLTRRCRVPLLRRAWAVPGSGGKW